MLQRRAISVAPAVILASVVHARADVTISSAQTQNMSCSGGICAPTANDAVLNVGDLETMLAAGNVSLATTGSGGVQAKDIRVVAALYWSSGSTLELDAYRSLALNRPVSIEGLAGLALTTNDGGSGGMLSFGKKGHVTFANISSTLTVDGIAYTLVDSIKSLAGAIVGNPGGGYALASDFDASQDGTYTSVPIPTPFAGTFEGLGNRISNLSIDDANDMMVALFAEVDVGGTLRDISVLHASISDTAGDSCAAPLVGFNFGNVIRASASGTVNSISCAGGLVGFHEEGTIVQSNASTTVSGIEAGGLVGSAFGSINQSFATGEASGSSYAGGLAGSDDGGAITDSYATGKVKGPSTAAVGGFAGVIDDGAQIGDSYSTGEVRGGLGGDNGTRGGFVGSISGVTFTDSYWDLDTSGVKHPWRGAGNRDWEPGITGLTTEQLQSELPPGFDPAIWGEDPNINGGLPYLIANQPPK